METAREAKMRRLRRRLRNKKYDNAARIELRRMQSYSEDSGGGQEEGISEQERFMRAKYPNLFKGGAIGMRNEI